jgi:RNA polymerase sigma factor (sigma-70 family)
MPGGFHRVFHLSTDAFYICPLVTWRSRTLGNDAFSDKENPGAGDRTSVSDDRLEAIEEAYRSRYPDFLRTATAIANSHEAGRDAVHDAFVSAIRKRRSYRGDAALEAWLWTIVVRCALKRRQRADERHANDDDVTDSVWTDRPRDSHEDLRAAIARLPERQRLALFLRYYGDLDYRSIAAVMGVKIGTVGAELHAAHDSLRRLIEEVPSHG